MNEINTAIYGKLQAGTALTALLAGTTSIYHQQPPDNTSMPYVIFNHQGGGNENINPSPMINSVYFIRGYSESSALAAGSIRQEIYNLLDGKALSPTGGWVNFWCKAEAHVEQIENLPNGKKAYMCGDFYRVRLDK